MSELVSIKGQSHVYPEASRCPEAEACGDRQATRNMSVGESLMRLVEPGRFRCHGTLRQVPVEVERSLNL